MFYLKLFSVSIYFVTLVVACVISTKIHNADQPINDVQGQLISMQSQINRLQTSQSEHIQGLQLANHKLSQKVTNLERIVMAHSSQQYLQTDFGCFSQLITLWCFDGGVINVTEAYYGQYANACDDQGECCMPDQVNDCRVAVLDNKPSDWFGLKLSCDNRTSCSYEYLGSAIDDCEEGYLADYMQIYYTCGTFSSYGPVGFSAYAEFDINYGSYVHVRFTGLISEFGDSYDRFNSTFTCPHHGVYLFSVTVKADNPGYAHLEIRLDDTTLAEAFADGDTHFGTGSSVVVAECRVGQEVWVSTGEWFAYVKGGEERQSVFTGYMLHRYE